MLSRIFKNWFQFCHDIYHHSATLSVSTIDLWNKIQYQMPEIALKDLKWLLTNKFSLKVTDLSIYLFLSNFVYFL